jgi:hypothetical protein
MLHVKMIKREEGKNYFNSCLLPLKGMRIEYGEVATNTLSTRSKYG